MKEKCPEWPIIPEQDESPKFGYRQERKVGKTFRIMVYFGYRSERKIEKFKKNPAIYIFWQLAATYCSNMMISEFFFPLKFVTLAHTFFNTKNTFV